MKLQNKQTSPKNNKSKGHDNLYQEFVYDMTIKTVRSKLISDLRSGLYL